MKRLRIVWIAVGVAALARASFQLAAFSLEQWELAAITRRTEDLKAAFDARDYTRPILRGTPEPGNAWDHYLPALQELDAEDKFHNEYVTILSAYLHKRPESDRGAVEGILSRHESVLDRIRRGTCCGEARFPYDWSLDQFQPGIEFGDPRFRYDWNRDWDFRNPHLQGQGLRLLGLSKARWLRDNGRDLEAADLLLDLCLFDRDRALNDFCPHAGGSVSMLDELHAILMAGRLSPPDIRRLDRELSILIEASPDPAHAFWNAVLEWGMEFRQEAAAGRQLRLWQHGDGPLIAGLRDCCSFRLLNARAFWMLDRWTHRLTTVATLEWPEARSMLRGVWEEVESAGPEFDLLTGVSTGGEMNRRQELAKLRLLRVAAHYLATREVLQIPDPFGSGPLKTSLGSTLKIWSVGRDGIDHGGLGSWKGWSKEDLVLEVPAGN